MGCCQSSRTSVTVVKPHSTEESIQNYYQTHYPCLACKGSGVETWTSREPAVRIRTHKRNSSKGSNRSPTLSASETPSSRIVEHTVACSKCYGSAIRRNKYKIVKCLFQCCSLKQRAIVSRNVIDFMILKRYFQSQNELNEFTDLLTNEFDIEINMYNTSLDVWFEANVDNLNFIWDDTDIQLLKNEIPFLQLNLCDVDDPTQWFGSQSGTPKFQKYQNSQKRQKLNNNHRIMENKNDDSEKDYPRLQLRFFHESSLFTAPSEIDVSHKLNKKYAIITPFTAKRLSTNNSDNDNLGGIETQRNSKTQKTKGEKQEKKYESDDSDDDIDASELLNFSCIIVQIENPNLSFRNYALPIGFESEIFGLLKYPKIQMPNRFSTNYSNRISKKRSFFYQDFYLNINCLISGQMPFLATNYQTGHQLKRLISINHTPYIMQQTSGGTQDQTTQAVQASPPRIEEVKTNFSQHTSTNVAGVDPDNAQSQPSDINVTKPLPVAAIGECFNLNGKFGLCWSGDTDCGNILSVYEKIRKGYFFLHICPCYQSTVYGYFRRANTNWSSFLSHKNISQNVLELLILGSYFSNQQILNKYVKHKIIVKYDCDFDMFIIPKHKHGDKWIKHLFAKNDDIIRATIIIGDSDRKIWFYGVNSLLLRRKEASIKYGFVLRPHSNQLGDASDELRIIGSLGWLTSKKRLYWDATHVCQWIGEQFGHILNGHPTFFNQLYFGSVSLFNVE